MSTTRRDASNLSKSGSEPERARTPAQNKKERARYSPPFASVSVLLRFFPAASDALSVCCWSFPDAGAVVLRFSLLDVLIGTGVITEAILVC